MIKFLLLAIVVLLIARMFWRVVDGIMDGARDRRQGARPSPMKLVRDPVCGTYVTPNTALSLTDRGATHYFCSQECRAKYRAA